MIGPQVHELENDVHLARLRYESAVQLHQSGLARDSHEAPQFVHLRVSQVSARTARCRVILRNFDWRCRSVPSWLQPADADKLVPFLAGIDPQRLHRNGHVRVVAPEHNPACALAKTVLVIDGEILQAEVLDEPRHHLVYRTTPSGTGGCTAAS